MSSYRGYEQYFPEIEGKYQKVEKMVLVENQSLYKTDINKNLRSGTGQKQKPFINRLGNQFDNYMDAILDEKRNAPKKLVDANWLFNSMSIVSKSKWQYVDALGLPRETKTRRPTHEEMVISMSSSDKREIL